MSYRGRELTAGNYLKLDDLQSQFNSSTTTFNLTSGGTAFYPGSAFSIQVVLGGVIQEPESAYTINQSQITFASAPGSGDDFFCIALGVSLGIGVPGEGTVTGTKLSKPFSYDDGLLVLDSTNNFIGVNSTTPTVALDVVGNVKVSGITTLGTVVVGGGTTQLIVTGNARITGILTVGTSSITLDGSNNQINVGTDVTVGSSSITVGSAFIKNNAVGLGTTNSTGRNAGVGTAAGTLIFNVTNARLEFYDGNAWVSIKSFGATGGTITFSGGKTIHTFTGSGTFSVNSGSSDVEYLVVAGGGGGGSPNFGGGGGAGGFRTGSAFPVSPGPYGITVGGGGGSATSGTPSVFAPGYVGVITSTGGGGGGTGNNGSGNPGGSGGGGAGNNFLSISSLQSNFGTGNTPPVSPSQGNAGGGGNRAPMSDGGGGGGGAGGVGTGNNNAPTPGGNGASSSITGTSTTYAGGGGGATPTGNGGSGGGGATGVSGTTNSGGGGGAAGPLSGASGGSGIIIIAYPS